MEEGHSSENDYLEQAQLGRIGVLFVVVTESQKRKFPVGYVYKSLCFRHIGKRINDISSLSRVQRTPSSGDLHIVEWYWRWRWV